MSSNLENQVAKRVKFAMDKFNILVDIADNDYKLDRINEGILSVICQLFDQMCKTEHLETNQDIWSFGLRLSNAIIGLGAPVGYAEYITNCTDYYIAVRGQTA